ncbi:MAG: FtsX-like permease family protein, partial [candidate division NC10 bacterium]|nr:FtsX-like permease family protein [candidate division NC10 bacterium]
EEMAEKYFGDADPIGKVISLDNSLDFKVTGVLRHIPRNSHFKFNFLASMASFEELASGYFKGLGAWFNNGFYTYLLLQESHDISGLEKQLPAFVQKYMAESFSVVSKSAYELDLNLEPLTDIYLRSNLSNQVEPVSDIRYVYIFSAIAFFILLIACINFTLLATACATRRAREVGVRKVLGAFRPQLITQLVCESTLLSIIALSLALGMVDLLLPFFNNLAGKALSMGYVSNAFTWIAIIGITLFVGLLAGGYPAFFLSAFQPAKVLSGASKSGSRGQPRLRKALVVFQGTHHYPLRLSLTVRTVRFLRSALGRSRRPKK